MKYSCIAAVALAWAALSPASASADASNCTYLNGPYCEMAHNIRHHGARLPIIWAQPSYYPIYPTAPVYPHQDYYQNSWYTAPSYYAPYVNTGYTTTCSIKTTYTCTYGSPYYSGY